MMFIIRVLMIAFLVSAAKAQSIPCVSKVFEGTQFTTCRYLPKEHRIEMAWKGPDGVALRNFQALAASLGLDRDRVLFAMNAGMFHANGAPVGLFIAKGKRETSLNLRNGPGNFHLKPNGVFWVDDKGGAHVDVSERFAVPAPRAMWATQSGPMLVIDGSLHPKFQDDGPSRLVRNGVGEGPNGSALFVISDGVVSFGKMARFYRDELKCRSALYLDGSVSALWSPQFSRTVLSPPLGPLVWVSAR